MKFFKELLIVVVFFALSNGLIAQNYSVRGGANIAKLVVKADTNPESVNFKTGFHLGVVGEFPINDVSVFETGLLLINKGVKTNLGISNTTVSTFYIDIPLTLKSYFDVGNTQVYSQVGPYIGMGLMGRRKGQVVTIGGEVEQNRAIEWGIDNTDDFKRLDMGLYIGVGATIEDLQFSLFYSWRMVNISPIDADGFNTNNRVWGLSVAYPFSGTE